MVLVPLWIWDLFIFVNFKSEFICQFVRFDQIFVIDWLNKDPWLRFHKHNWNRANYIALFEYSTFYHSPFEWNTSIFFITQTKINELYHKINLFKVYKYRPNLSFLLIYLVKINIRIGLNGFGIQLSLVLHVQPIALRIIKSV